MFYVGSYDDASANSLGTRLLDTYRRKDNHQQPTLEVSSYKAPSMGLKCLPMSRLGRSGRFQRLYVE